jgi:hypothetical protein
MAKADTSAKQAPKRTPLHQDLQVMAKLDRIISPLEAGTKDRVLKWLVDAYCSDDMEPARFSVANGSHAP